MGPGRAQVEVFVFMAPAFGVNPVLFRLLRMPGGRRKPSDVRVPVERPSPEDGEERLLGGRVVYPRYTLVLRPGIALPHSLAGVHMDSLNSSTSSECRTPTPSTRTLLLSDSPLQTISWRVLKYFLWSPMIGRCWYMIGRCDIQSSS